MRNTLLIALPRHNKTVQDKSLRIMAAAIFDSLLTSATVLALAGGASVLHYNDVMSVADTGYATNCGTNPFLLSWSPKVLSSYDTIKINYSFVPQYNLTTGGVIALTSWHEGAILPSINASTKIVCSETVAQYIACPMIAKERVEGAFKVPYNFSQALRQVSGQYHILVKVLNKDEREIFCFEADINVNNDK